MRKRGNAEGSIYQRKSDGRYVGAYKAADGRRRAIYGWTRKEVSDRLIQAQLDTQRGIVAGPQRLTVGGHLDEWLRAAAPSLRPRTQARYREIVDRHIAPTLGKTALVRLTPQQVQALLNSKLAEGLSSGTVIYIRAVLRRGLTQALRWGLVSRNAAALVDPPAIERRESRVLSPAEARAFLEVIRGDRLEGLYTIALSLGLREGEAFALRWEDIDFTASTLTVRHALLRMKGRVELAEPKTPRSRRTIAIPQSTAAALRTHRARQLGERLAAAGLWQDWGLVFSTGVGTPLNRSDVLRAFRRHLVAAGLPQMRFLDLRHSCASLLLAQGVHPRVVMETLGHSTINVTMNVYTHVLPELQRTAAERMDTLLTSAV
jgi:integrase